MPGTWTLQGYDKPHYTNVIMPFGNVPPSAPAAHNPTGLYRIFRRCPAHWERRRTVLHVGGAESFLEAWCNGERSGLFQGHAASHRVRPHAVLSARAPTSWPSWWSATRTPASSRTRTSGGMAASTAACISTAPTSHTSPTWTRAHPFLRSREGCPCRGPGLPGRDRKAGLHIRPLTGRGGGHGARGLRSGRRSPQGRGRRRAARRLEGRGWPCTARSGSGPAASAQRPASPMAMAKATVAAAYRSSRWEARVLLPRGSRGAVEP